MRASRAAECTDRRVDLEPRGSRARAGDEHRRAHAQLPGGGLARRASAAQGHERQDPQGGSGRRNGCGRGGHPHHRRSARARGHGALRELPGDATTLPSTPRCSSTRWSISKAAVGSTDSRWRPHGGLDASGRRVRPLALGHRPPSQTPVASRRLAGTDPAGRRPRPAGAGRLCPVASGRAACFARGLGADPQLHRFHSPNRWQSTWAGSASPICKICCSIVTIFLGCPRISSRLRRRKV